MDTKIYKMSEKLLLWMKRNNKTQIEVAKELGITRQSLASRMKDNYFTTGEIIKLKELGVN